MNTRASSSTLSVLPRTVSCVSEAERATYCSVVVQVAWTSLASGKVDDLAVGCVRVARSAGTRTALDHDGADAAAADGAIGGRTRPAAADANAVVRDAQVPRLRVWMYQHALVPALVTPRLVHDKEVEGRQVADQVLVAWEPGRRAFEMHCNECKYLASFESLRLEVRVCSERLFGVCFVRHDVYTQDAPQPLGGAGATRQAPPASVFCHVTHTTVVGAREPLLDERSGGARSGAREREASASRELAAGACRECAPAGCVDRAAGLMQTSWMR